MHWTATCPFGATKEALVQMGQFSSSWVRPPSVLVSGQKKIDIRNGLIQAGLLRQ
jgi:hypothetical protein